MDQMTAAANAASEAIGLLKVPFLSAMMGGVETGIDTRDTKKQGTKYNGSGCLIHGLSVVADSFVAIDTLLRERPEDADRLVEALRTNFEHDPEMHQYLLSCKNLEITKRWLMKRPDVSQRKSAILFLPERIIWGIRSEVILRHRQHICCMVTGWEQHRTEENQEICLDTEWIRYTGRHIRDWASGCCRE